MSHSLICEGVEKMKRDRAVTNVETTAYTIGHSAIREDTAHTAKRTKQTYVAKAARKSRS